MDGLFYSNKKLSIALMVGLTIAAAAAITISFSYNVTAAVITTSSSLNKATQVQVGGGDPTNPLFGYKPQNVEIKA
jgi:hypothetical protein